MRVLAKQRPASRLESLTLEPESQAFFDTAFTQIMAFNGFNMDGTTTPPPDADPNVWQVISEATGTVVTPANAIDLLGFMGAKYGIARLDSWKGIAVACASFMADFVDGKVARATGTASELGEALDAAGDKVKLAYALYKIHELDLAPKPLLYAVAVQNGLNTGLTLADKAVNGENSVIHASWFGKRAIFMQQWGLGLHVIGSQMEKGSMKHAKAVKASGSVLGAAGVGFGAVATAGYAHRFWQSRH